MALNPPADDKDTEVIEGEKIDEKDEKKEEKDHVDEKKPFQKLLFLVRDWQNFDNDFEEGENDETFNIVCLQIIIINFIYIF